MSTALKVVIIVVVVVVVLAVAAAAFIGLAVVHAVADTVTIPQSEVGYDYTGTTSDYLTLNTTLSSCPDVVSGGSTFTCTVVLISTALVYTHYIDDFSANSPFSVSSVSPTLPVTMAVGASATFEVSISAPSGPGSYDLTLTVTTN